MPRLCWKRMFYSATLIGVGVAMFVYGSNNPGSSYIPLIMFVAASANGAGIFMPFGRPYLGAFVGFSCLLLTFIISFARHPAM